MNKKYAKRLYAVLLALVVLFGQIPATAFAETDATTPVETEQTGSALTGAASAPAGDAGALGAGNAAGQADPAPSGATDAQKGGAAGEATSGTDAAVTPGATDPQAGGSGGATDPQAGGAAGATDAQTNGAAGEGATGTEGKDAAVEDAAGASKTEGGEAKQKTQASSEETAAGTAAKKETAKKGLLSETRGVQTESSVARIGDEYYDTLPAAIDAVTEGGTITLLAGIDLGTAELEVGRALAFTINLNGYNITSAGENTIDLAAGSLTVTGGGTVINNYTSSSFRGVAVQVASDASFTLQGAALVSSGWAALETGRGSTATITNGTITNPNNHGISSYGTLTVKGSKIGVGLNGIYVHGGTASLSNNAIVANENGVFADQGTTTITDCTINVPEKSSKQYAAVYANSNPTVTITGGSLTGPSGVYASAGRVDINDGTVVTGTYNNECSVVAANQGQIYLNGGYYSDTYGNSSWGGWHLPTGKQLVRVMSGEHAGYYVIGTVVAQRVVNKEASDKYEQTYASLADAIADTDNSTLPIELLANAKVDTLAFNKANITLDLSGKTLTATGQIAVTAKTTITDTSEDKTGRIEVAVPIDVSGGTYNFEIQGGTLYAANSSVVNVSGKANLILNGGSIDCDSRTEPAVNFGGLGLYLPAGSESMVTAAGTAIQATGGYVSIQDGEINGTTGIAVSGTCKAIVDGGVIEAADDASVTLDSSEGASFAINGGFFSDGAGNLSNFTRKGGKYLFYDATYGFYSLADGAVAINTKTFEPYTTLPAAIGALQGTDETIQLVENIDMGDTRISLSGKSFTLDLNGHELSGSNAILFDVDNGSKITIEDSSADPSVQGENNGKILAYGVHAFLATNGSSLTVKDGEIRSPAKSIFVEGNGASVTINGGIVAGSNAITNKAATLTVNGGSIVGLGTTEDSGYGIVTKDAGTTTIDDGVIAGTKQALSAEDTAVFTLNGGIYKDDGANAGEPSYVLPKGKLLMKVGGDGEYKDYYALSGDVAKIGENHYPSLAAAVAAANADDTIVMVKDSKEAGQIDITKNITLDLAGHTVTMPRRMDAYAETNVRITGGTFTLKDSSADKSGTLSFEQYNYVFVYGSTASFVMDGGNIISGGPHAISAVGGTVTINDGVIEAPSGNYPTVTVGTDSTYRDVKITINGGTIRNTGGGEAVSITGRANGTSELLVAGGTISGGTGVSVKNNAKATVSGGTISGTQYGIRAQCTDSSRNTAVEVSGGEISGDRYGIYAESETTAVVSANTEGGDDPVISSNGGKSVGVDEDATFNINGGYFGDTAGNGEGFTRADNKVLVSSTNKTGYYELGDAVALNTKTLAAFSTLPDAISALEGTDETIRLLKGVNLGSERIALSGTSFTLDLNGQKLWGSNRILFDLDDGSAITVDDSSIAGNGSVATSGSHAFLVGDNSSLIVKRGAISSNASGIYLDSTDSSATASATIEGGSVEGLNAAITNNGKTLTVKGGTFNSSDCGIITKGTGTTIIEGGVIKGPGEHGAVYAENTATVQLFGGYYSDDAANRGGSQYVFRTGEKLYKVGGDGEYAEYYTPRKLVAKIGDVVYESLAAALEAVGHGETIVMIDNSIEEAIEINKPDTTFTIDLAGKTVTVPTIKVINDYIIKIEDSSVPSTGTIKFEGGNVDAGLEVFGTDARVDLDSGTLSAQNYSVVGVTGPSAEFNLYDDDASIVSGGERPAVFASDGDVFVYKGTITASGEALQATDNGTVTVDDGVINGDISKTGSTAAFNINGGAFKTTTGNGDGFTRADDKTLVKIASGNNKGMYQLGEAEAQNTTTGDYFERIDDAKNFLQDKTSGTEVIKVLKDINLDNSTKHIYVYDAFTLDLNGHTLSSTDSRGTIWIGNPGWGATERPGILTIIDSSDDKTGMVLNDGNGNAVHMDGNTFLTLSSGTLKSKADAIHCGFVTINGGTVESEANALSGHGNAAGITINDGTIKAGSDSKTIEGFANDGCWWRIYGGKFSDASGNADFITRKDGKYLVDEDGDGWHELGDAVAIITGNGAAFGSLAKALKAASADDEIKMIADSDEVAKSIGIDKTVTVDLNGKQVSFDTHYPVISVTKPVTFTVKDSSEGGAGVLKNVSREKNYRGFTGTVIETVYQAGATLVVQGGTIEGGSVSVFNIYPNTLSMSGGTIKATDASAEHGAAVNTDAGNINISGGTIDGSEGKYGIYAIGNMNLDISDKVTVKGSEAGILVDSWGPKVNMSGGTVEGTGEGSSGIHANMGEVRVSGGTVKGTAYGVNATNEGDIRSVSVTIVDNAVIEGGTASVNNDWAASKFKINGGIFSDATGNSDKYTRSADKYLVKITSGAHEGMYELDDAVAWSVGTNKYYAALTVANHDSEAGETIQMLADTTVGGTIGINKDITLDLNGHEISSDFFSAPFWINAKLTLIDSSATDENPVGEGSITNSNAEGWGMYVCGSNGAHGELDMQAGTVSGGLYGIEGNSANGVTINGGHVHGGTYGIWNHSGGFATVEGGTVTGGDTAVYTEFGNIVINGGTIGDIGDANTKTLGVTDSGKVEINGGRFSDTIGNDDAYTRKDDMELRDWDGDEWYELGHEIAKIGDTIYPSIQAALNAAAVEGDTVVLLKDTTESFSTGKKVTLDLGGNKLTVDESQGIRVSGAGSLLKIKNGTIESAADADNILTAYDQGYIELFDGLTVNVANTALYARDKGSIEVNGATVNGGNTAPAAVVTGADSTIMVSNGIVNGASAEYPTISVENGGNFKLSGGTANSTGGSTLVVQGEGSRADINSGNLTNTSEDSATSVAIARDSGVINFAPGSEGGANVSNDNGDGIIAEFGGTVIFKGDSITVPDGKSALAAKGGTVTVNDGVVNGEVSTTEGSTFNISGGVFKTDTGNGEGFTRDDNKTLVKIASDDHEGMYALKFVVALDVDTEKYWDSLQAAIDKAEEGDVIKLLINREEQITIEKSLTLDLNGKILFTPAGNKGTTVTITGADTEVTIKGNGTITGPSNTAYAILVTEAAVIIDGAYVSSPGTTVYAYGESSSVTLKNGTIEATGNSPAISTGGASAFVMSGGTVKNSYNDTKLGAVRLNGSGNSAISGGSISTAGGTGPAVIVSNGILTVSGDETRITAGGTGNALQAGGINDTPGTIIVNGGKIHGAEYGICDKGTVTVNNGYITGGKAAAYSNANTITINDGYFGDTTKTNIPTLAKGNDGQIIINGGYFSDTVGNGDDYTRAEGKMLMDEDGDKWFTLETAVASITRSGAPVYYSTLATAIADASSGETVTMVADSTEAAFEINKADASVTVDLAGKTVTVPSIKVNAGTIEIEDSSDPSAGKIVFAGGTEDAGLSVSGGSAIITKGTVTAEGAALSAEGGTVEVNGGVINGDISKAETSSTFNINGGVFKTDTGNGEGFTRDGGKTLVKITKSEDPHYEMYRLDSARAYNVEKKEYYASLEEAQDVVGTGQTIQMLDNIDYGTEWFFVCKEFTLDLNGFMLSSSNSETGADNGGVVWIGFQPSVGKLTVKDSSTDGTGKIVNKSGVDRSKTIFVTSTTKFTLESGSIECTNGYGVYSYWANTTISGGNVSGKVGVYNTSSGNVTVMGGQISGSSASVENNGSTFNINGGKFGDQKGNAGNFKRVDDKMLMDEDGDGWYELKTAVAKRAVTYIDGDENKTVKEFLYSSLSEAIDAVEFGENIVEQGVTLLVDTTDHFTLDSGRWTTLDLDGKTLTVDQSEGVRANGSFIRLIIKNGTIVAAAGADDIISSSEEALISLDEDLTVNAATSALYVYDKGNIYVEGAIVNGGSKNATAVVEGRLSNIHVSSGEVNGPAGDYPTVSVKDEGLFFLHDGGAVNATHSSALRVEGEGSRAEIWGGILKTSVEDPAYCAGVALDRGKIVLTNGEKSSGEKTSGEVISEHGIGLAAMEGGIIEVKAGVVNGDVSATEGSTFNINGGVFKTDTGNGEGYTRADGKMLVEITSGEHAGMYQLGDSVASIERDGEITCYTTLADAHTDVAEGETVKILKTIDLGETAFSSTKTYTLDLNGFEIKGTADGVVAVDGGSLTVIDSSAEGTGKIHNNNSDGWKRAVTVGRSSDAAFTLQSGTLTSDKGYGLANFGQGTTTISGGQIEGPYGIEASGGTVTFPEGSTATVKGTTHKSFNKTGGTVNINGGYFSDATGNGDAFNRPEGEMLVKVVGGDHKGWYALGEAVAQNEQTGDLYSNLPDAYGDVEKNANHTIRLLKDIEQDSDWYYIFDAITLDLNGHTITGTNDEAIFGVNAGKIDGVEGNGVLTIKDSSEGKTGAIVNSVGSAVRVYNNYMDYSHAKLTVESGTLQGAQYGIDISGYSPVDVVVNGGKIIGEKKSTSFVKSDSKTFAINGGLFSDNKGNSEGFTRKDNKTLVKIGLGENAGMYELGDAVAKNKTTGEVYGSLADAVADAKTGETIQMLAADTIKSTITVDKNLTLDLNGQTVTSNMKTGINITGAANFTLTDESEGAKGKLTRTSSASGAAWNGLLETDDNFTGEVVLRKGTIETPGDFAVDKSGSGKLTVDGATVKGGYSALHISEGSVEVKKGSLEASEEAVGIYPNGNNKSVTLDVSGGNIKGRYRAIRAGSNFNGTKAEINVSGGEITSGVAGQSTGNVRATIAADDNSGIKVSVNVSGGTIKQLDTAKGAIENNKGPVAITGGTVIYQLADNAAGVKASEGVEISGGWFATKVAEGYLADGYDATDEQADAPNKDAKYTVAKQRTITYTLPEGAKNSEENPAVFSTVTAPVELADPTWEDHDFQGWFTTEDFTGNAVTELTADMATADVTLYAKFGPDKKPLKDLVAQVPDPDDVNVSTDGKDLQEDEWWATKEDKDVYEDALAKAQTVLEDKGATQEDVDKALTDLQEAEKKLKKVKIDKTGLQTLVDMSPDPAEVAESDDGSDVHAGAKWATPEDLAAYKDALQKAKDVLADKKATQNDVDAARKTLGEAVAKIKTAGVDKETLQKAVAEAPRPEAVAESENGKDVPAGDLWATKADRDAYIDALTKAVDALLNADTQDAVDEALADLQEAEKKLKTAETDKKNLQTLVDMSPDPSDVAESDDGGDVHEGAKWATPEDKAAYEEALEKAQSLLDDPKATQNDVDAALKTLGEAATKIKTAGVDKEALQNALAEAPRPENVAESEDGKDVPADDLWATPADREAYINALTKAGEALLNADTQDAVDKALADLQEAEKKLKTAETDKSALQTLADAVPDPAEVTESEDGRDVQDGAQWATPEDKAAYEEALEKAQAVLDDPKATQNDVDAARKTLGEAVAKIKTAGVDKETLQKAVAEAPRPAEVTESEDGADVRQENKWATPEDLAAYKEAYEKAGEVLVKPMATQQEVDEALAALQAAKEKLQDGRMPKATIRYDLNGGTYNGSEAAIEEAYYPGEEITIHDAPTREGYTFDYWMGSAYQPGDTYTVTDEGHTFVAQWIKNEEPDDGKTTPDDGKKDDKKTDGNSNTGKKDSGTNQATAPKTADAGHADWWFLIMTAGLLGLLWSAQRRRREEER